MIMKLEDRLVEPCRGFFRPLITSGLNHLEVSAGGGVARRVVAPVTHDGRWSYEGV